MQVTIIKPIMLSILMSTLLSQACHAAITLDRTRIIFSGDDKAIALNIGNENKQYPFLAQGWVEDEHGNKISSPLMALPPVQRVEPGAKSIIKVQALPGISSLPKDRESLFYFNLREIPPRSQKPNVLQIALQTKIKLFYRPASLMPTKTAAATPWQEQLILNHEGDKYIVNNPTPYYVTIVDATAKGGKSSGEFKSIMIAPHANGDLGVSASGLGANPVLKYINDYGGRPTLTFTCAGANCKVAANKVEQ